MPPAAVSVNRLNRRTEFQEKLSKPLLFLARAKGMAYVFHIRVERYVPDLLQVSCKIFLRSMQWLSGLSNIIAELFQLGIIDSIHERLLNAGCTQGRSGYELFTCAQVSNCDKFVVEA